MMIGRKTCKVALERETQTQTASGSVERAWTELGQDWASIEPLRGDERVQAQAVNASISHRIRMRHNALTASLLPRDRLRYGARLFDLEAPRNLWERNREVEIMATERIEAP